MYNEQTREADRAVKLYASKHELTYSEALARLEAQQEVTATAAAELHYMIAKGTR